MSSAEKTKYRNSVSCAKCKTYKESFSIYSISYCLAEEKKEEEEKKKYFFADKRKEISRRFLSANSISER